MKQILARPITEVRTSLNGVTLGERYTAPDGNVYIQLQAPVSASLAIGQLVTFDALTFLATALTKAEADKLKPMAVSMAAFASQTAAQYGWFCISGVVSVLAAANATKEGAVYTTGTAGVVDVVATSQTKINRSILLANNGASQALTKAYIYNPSAA